MIARRILVVVAVGLATGVLTQLGQGPLGRWWRVGTDVQRAIALTTLGAVFVAEGAYLLGLLPEAAVGAGFILAGLVVPLLAARSWADRFRGHAAMIPALALGAVGYVAFGAFYGVVTGT